jgi:RNA polymerase sigma-70 factor (ECF subfamily)
MHSLADEALISLIKQGDTDAFERLAARYEKKVYSLAWRLTGRHEDAGDLAQEAFMKAWRSMGNFRGDASFGTWMTHIVTNIWRDEIRKHHMAYETLDERLEQIPAEAIGPEALYERKERQEWLQGLINELPHEYKLVLVLRDIEGCAYKEIAVMTGLALGTVKSRISRARMSLREKLQAAGVINESKEPKAE